ncbi:hypothetical protein V8F33_012522 [Rhypophila sp. PSN 637]
MDMETLYQADVAENYVRLGLKRLQCVPDKPNAGVRSSASRNTSMPATTTFSLRPRNEPRVIQPISYSQTPSPSGPNRGTQHYRSTVARSATSSTGRVSLFGTRRTAKSSPQTNKHPTDTSRTDEEEAEENVLPSLAPHALDLQYTRALSQTVSNMRSYTLHFGLLFDMGIGVRLWTNDTACCDSSLEAALLWFGLRDVSEGLGKKLTLDLLVRLQPRQPGERCYLETALRLLIRRINVIPYSKQRKGCGKNKASVCASSHLPREDMDCACANTRYDQRQHLNVRRPKSHRISTISQDAQAVGLFS